MRNWGYLGTLFTSWRLPSFLKGNKLLRYRHRRNLIRLGLSLIGLLYFSYCLKKIYEVPVYATRFDVVTENCVLDKEKGVNIVISRNYDREDKNSLKHDEVWEEYNKKKNFSGGIYINGRTKTQRGVSNATEKVVSRVKYKLNSLYAKYNYPPIDNANIVYVSAMSTRRQDFQPPAFSSNEHLDTANMQNAYITYFNGVKELNDSCVYRRNFEYLKRGGMEDGNSHILEKIVASSEEDNAMIFVADIATLANGVPSVFVAEDISKMVEVILVKQPDSNVVDSLGLWDAVTSLTFDYMGSAEFSEHIVPEPDEISVSSIRYTDKAKLKEIGKNGLRFHVKFPDMENMQESRIFILSAIVTALGALVLRYLWRILYDLYKWLAIVIKNRKKIRRCIDIVGITFLLWFVYKVLKGLYYSHVNPFDMYNYIVD